MQESWSSLVHGGHLIAHILYCECPIQFAHVLVLCWLESWIPVAIPLCLFGCHNIKNFFQFDSQQLNFCSCSCSLIPYMYVWCLLQLSKARKLCTCWTGTIKKTLMGPCAAPPVGGTGGTGGMGSCSSTGGTCGMTGGIPKQTGRDYQWRTVMNHFMVWNDTHIWPPITSLKP